MCIGGFSRGENSITCIQHFIYDFLCYFLNDYYFIILYNFKFKYFIHQLIYHFPIFNESYDIIKSVQVINHLSAVT